MTIELIFNYNLDGDDMKKNSYVCDCNIIHEDKVNSCINSMPNEDIFLKLSNLYKLIGDNTRCKILFALDTSEMCVCDLANVLNMTKSNISHQLALLKKNSIVKNKKIGKEVYYSLDDNHIKELFQTALEHIKEGEGYEERIN